MLLKDIREYDGIYLATGMTDLRKSVTGLAHIVKQDFRMDPFGNYMFLFCNKNRNRLKALSWDKNGFCMKCRNRHFMQYPSPSHSSIFTLSRLLLQNTNNAPPYGSSLILLSTIAASPLICFLISVWPQHKYTCFPEKLIMTVRAPVLLQPLFQAGSCP